MAYLFTLNGRFEWPLDIGMKSKNILTVCSAAPESRHDGAVCKW
jgi:hypothetical protein